MALFRKAILNQKPEETFQSPDLCGESRKSLKREPPWVAFESMRHWPPRYRPVFVLAQHRSGGTLLTRLLNCHEGLVVWGEHAGFLEGLADAYSQLERFADHLPRRSWLELRRYVLAYRLADVGFEPWMSPFSAAEFLTECRRNLLALFTRGLSGDQRWGFKEIRYHSPRIIQFLHKLFPRGQFVVMERSPTEICVSCLLAPWLLKTLLADGVDRDEPLFLRTVRNQLYDILAMRQNRTEGLSRIGAQSICVQYEKLVSDIEWEMQRVFDFLDLAADDLVKARMRVSIGTVTGATSKESGPRSEDRGYLTAAGIREAVERFLPEVNEQLAKEASPGNGCKRVATQKFLADGR